MASKGLSVLLLGTQAGPPPVPGRAGIASAVVVDGATYVIDCGRGAVTQFQHAGLEYSTLRSILLTHLHADHVCDYYNFFLLAGANAGSHNVIPQPVDVFGPASAGKLPPVAGAVEVATIVPSDPVPGTAAMTEHLHAAFAYSSNTYLRENPINARLITDLPRVHELLPVDPTTPFVVMEDERVKVTAVPVPHGDVYPSFAFRFDSDHGAVTFSGDTRMSDTVCALAHGCDVLVHEAVSLPESGLPDDFRTAMLADHTLVEETGQVAQRAGVPHLVLSHVIDFAGPLNVHDWERRAGAGYDGTVTVASDLMRVSVGGAPA